MTMLWVNEAIERLPPLGYRTRIVLCGGLAAAVPMLLLAAVTGSGVVLIGACFASLWFLFCQHRLLLPLRSLSRALDACVASEASSSSEPLRNGDELDRMTANVDRIIQRLDRAKRNELDVSMAELTSRERLPADGERHGKEAKTGRSAAR